MDKENVLCLYNGGLLISKNSDIMKFVGKCMEVKKIILSEETQT